MHQMNRNIITIKDIHLEVEVELYPREKTLSLLSRFPEKLKKPLTMTVSQDNEPQLLNEQKFTINNRSNQIFSEQIHTII